MDAAHRRRIQFITIFNARSRGVGIFQEYTAAQKFVHSFFVEGAHGTPRTALQVVGAGFPKGFGKSQTENVGEDIVE
uniref:Uncharacterized protein n=1 Tax=Romanomermis culicivorax TaxID=13658 RepID=A0A915HMH3_ROMCU